MAQDQTPLKKLAIIKIKPFEWQDWDAMWMVRRYQLAEAGIPLDCRITPPDFTIIYDETDPNYHEIDMDRIDECYLKGRGNFWIAWMDGKPVGYIGAQDKGDTIELRRMYVRKEYRRLGIGTNLVMALIDHCRRQKAGRIKLWTGVEGPGCFLYAALGFRQVALQDNEANHPSALSGEIRMCLEMRST